MLYEQLAQGIGKDRIIDKLIEYAERKELVGTLLTLAEELNPVKYEKYQPYYTVTTSPTRSRGDRGEESRRAIKPSIEAQEGGQIALEGGININIGSFHGGRVNIGPGEQASRVPSSSESVSGQVDQPRIF